MKRPYNDVYIVDGTRTPFLKARGKPGPFSASDLAVAAGMKLLEKQPFKPTEIDEVIVGSVMPREYEANIARIVGLRLGCGDSVPAWTVQRNCGSGMQAIDSAVKDIANERHQLVLAGGTESMSNAPLIYNNKFVNWFSNWAGAKKITDRVKLLFDLKPQFLRPVFALEKGLCDPIVGLSMGQTAEKLAYLFNISRNQMDEFALTSHQRALAALSAGNYPELVNLYDKYGNLYEVDTGVRQDTTLEKLAKLKPFFDKFGNVTAGNSSQITDGAAMLLLAHKDTVKKYNLPVLGRVVDINWAALPPDIMGLGPIFAATPLLKKHQLGLNDIDYWEINEAFAAQVLACKFAWEDESFCQKYLGTEPLGTLDINRLNVDGGAIALGHPVGASGARLVLHLLHVLKRENARYGMATLCIGGGQGGAMLLERVDSVSE